VTVALVADFTVARCKGRYANRTAVADHVTAVFAVPVTVAVNCCVPPEDKVALEGEMLTAIPGRVTAILDCDRVRLGSAIGRGLSVTLTANV